MTTNYLSWVFLGIIVGASIIAVLVTWRKGRVCGEKPRLPAEEISEYISEARANQPSNSELFPGISCNELIQEGAIEMEEDGFRMHGGSEQDV